MLSVRCNCTSEPHAHGTALLAQLALLWTPTQPSLPPNTQQLHDCYHEFGPQSEPDSRGAAHQYRSSHQIEVQVASLCKQLIFTAPMSKLSTQCLQNRPLSPRQSFDVEHRGQQHAEAKRLDSQAVGVQLSPFAQAPAHPNEKPANPLPNQQFTHKRN